MAGLVPAIHVGEPQDPLTVMAGLVPAIRVGEPQDPLTVMAGLVPAIHVGEPHEMRRGFVYILTNRPNGTLYVGVTSDLIRRVSQHREGAVPGFTKRYGIKRLVYFEQYDAIRDAIQREHNVKHWSRTWKVRLILKANPEWHDLFETLF